MADSIPELGTEMCRWAKHKRIPPSEILSTFNELKYAYANSPDSVDLAAIFAPEGGVNCLTFAHMYLEEVCGWFGLPKDEHFTGKAYYESSFFRVVENERFLDGDIFLFGPKDLIDLHKLHVAVYTGEQACDGSPLLQHATNHPFVRGEKPCGGVVFTSLKTMLSKQKYAKLYGVRRLR